MQRNALMLLLLSANFNCEKRIRRGILNVFLSQVHIAWTMYLSKRLFLHMK